MKSSVILIISIVFLFGLNNSSKKANCDLLPRVSTNSPSRFSMSEIDSSDYKPEKFSNANKLTLFSNSDSIERRFNKEYPKIFKKTNKGYKFKSFGGDDIIVENNLEQEKTYSKYEFKAKYKNFVILSLTYFEGGEAVLINLDTGSAFVTIGKPHFITDNYIYSYADYYGDSDINLFNIKSKEFVNLAFDNLSIIDSYNISGHIFFKAICMNSMEEKYFEILNL